MHFSTFVEQFFDAITDKTKAEAKKLIAKITEIVGRKLGIHGVDHFEIDGNLRLGVGSFGVAGVSAEDTNKVVKLTTDPEEVKAAYMLIGKRLPHVVEFFKAGYLAKIHVKNIKTGMTQPLGITVCEKLDRIRTSTVEGNKKLREIVTYIQVTQKVRPEQIMNMPPDLAKRRLKKASLALMDLLLGTEFEDLHEIAEGIEELRAMEIYAVDFHPGNVGYSNFDHRHKVFDVGLSSVPKWVTADTFENPVEGDICYYPNPTFCWPMQSISGPEIAVPVIY